jgi:hypothetical protein
MVKLHSPQDFEHMIVLSFSSQDRILLVVSGQLGEQLVPKIHQLRQVSTIYVYCTNKKKNEQWTKQFAKVYFTKHSSSIH